jgi:F-box protein 39
MCTIKHVIEVDAYLPCGVQMVRERISTSTVLLLAHTARNLHYLFIRRNAVILRCDWPQSPDWSLEFYQWLRSASKSYNATEKEVSQILGYTWFMLSDRQFKLTHIDLHHEPF